MADTKIKAGQFFGVVGHGTDGYFLMTNADGSMSWAEGGSAGPSVTSVSYPGDDTAADPAGGQTVVLTGTNFGSSMTVSIGGTTAPSVAHDSSTQLTITTPAKAAGDYDIVVTNTVTGASGTFVNGISYNGIPSWTTAAGSLGTFNSETTISTITLQATEPDGGTITFNITNGALPSGLSLTGANIDGTTTAESSTTLYSFTIEAIDDENQATPRNFSITVNSAEITPSENFTINTYTGNGSTQSIEGKIGTAASFNGSSSYISSSNPFSGQSGDGQIYSISIWFKADSFSSQYPTLFKGRGTGETPPYVWLTASKIRFHGYKYGDATVSLNTNQWYHLVVIENNGVISGYLDGTSITFSNQLIWNQTNGANLFIGGDPNSSSYYWDGKIDQVRIFDKALSSGEVTTLYGESNTSTTKSTTDIFDDGSGVALYEFEEGAKDTGTTPYGTGAIDSGQSAVFNGSSSIMYVNGFDTTTNFSISLWFNTSASSNQVLANNGGGEGSNTGFLWWLDSSGKISLATSSGGSNFNGTKSSLSYNDGNWHHAVLNYASNGAYSIYVDNQSIVSETSSRYTGSAVYGRPFAIGAWTQLNQLWFNGSIDQVRVYSSALSPSDVEALVSETNVPTANLVAHYKLDGNGNDETTNYDGTWSGTEAYSDPAEFLLVQYNGTPTNVGFVGTSFQPDLVWIKSRTDAYDNNLLDSVRGDFMLNTNRTVAQEAGFSGVVINSNGFTVDESVTGTTDLEVNRSSSTYVAWCWKAGGAAVSNTDGSITSSVSANPDAGFSIVKWVGSGSQPQTVGHGLSSAPELVIYKDTDTTSNWHVYHESVMNAGDAKFLRLNTTDAMLTDGGDDVWTSGFSSTTFGIGNANNASGNTHIAYCFHSVDGYQKVGSYLGNGGAKSITGLGFTPRFVLFKCSTTTGAWIILDSTRGSSVYFDANTSAAENSTWFNFTFDSDGWSVNTNNNNVNGSGQTYIYLAIA